MQFVHDKDQSFLLVRPQLTKRNETKLKIFSLIFFMESETIENDENQRSNSHHQHDRIHPFYRVVAIGGVILRIYDRILVEFMFVFDRSIPKQMFKVFRIINRQRISACHSFDRLISVSKVFC